AQSSKPTVRVGFIGDLTGANSAIVTPGRDAAKLAFKLANQDADFPVNVEFVPKDNKDASESTAPGLAQQLINDPKVLGVIGPAFSGETSAVGPLFKNAGLAHISQSATRADLTAQGWHTFFRGVGGDADQAKAAADLVKAIGCKKIALINDKSPYGQGYIDIARENLDKSSIVLDEGIAPATDYTTLVDSLLSNEPDVVLYGGYVAQGPLIVKQMRAKGVDALFVCGDGCKDDKFVTDAGADASGVLFTCPCLDPNVSDAADAKDFVSKFQAEYNKAPGIYAAEAWDVAQIFIAALKSGATDRAAVLKFVTDLKDFKGLTKTFNWTTDEKELHEVTDKGVNIYAVEEGKIVLKGPVQEFTS
ncbi:MAG TPA: branched-chain amino acid ABC transporter substrate-binding protein, partial [Actinomycetota bacterium]|nr:branched-chain amino acid ABC transporter substrate-binding protein [Actinomycetota bacterium]